MISNPESSAGISSAVRLYDASNDIVAVFLTGLGLQQHLISLADARCCANENSELPDTPVLAASRLKQSFG
jgi:hypothetical protein